MRSSQIRSITLMLLASLLLPGVARAQFTRLQVLLPGESPAPGTSGGKTGLPISQTEGVPFDIRVRACDTQWNTVTSVTDIVQLSSTDASATLPAAASLQAGERTFSVTLNAGGAFTFTADDQTDPTIPDATSSTVASLVLQGFAFSTINQKNQYAGQPFTITLRAVDASGATVTGYSGDVQLKTNTSFGDGRVTPGVVTLSGGTWTGAVTCYRADETSINRGNVNLFAWLDSAPWKNGTSDPFTVHPGSFSRVQLIVPGEAPLPGSISGKTGTPASQSAGQPFRVDVYATDPYWNLVPSSDNVRITSPDAAASTPVTGAMTNGTRSFDLSLGTVGPQTLTVADLSNTGIQGMTSPPIPVTSSAAAAFAIDAIPSPVTAGSPLSVTIRAVDGTGNTVPDFSGDAVLQANTGSGSISPELITFTNGQWSGAMVFRGAGQAVQFSCSDFSSPPHIGTSNSFVVDPGPVSGLQVLLPGETPRGGTASGKQGTPLPQQAGTPFQLTVRAVDQFWNRVQGIADTVGMSSTDLWATMPAETSLVNGEIVFPVTLYRTGGQRIMADNVSRGAQRPDTSSLVFVTGGPFSRVLILAPGESVAPGTETGRTGAATDQSINYAFNVEIVATDEWWNPVGGPTDVVHVTSDDPLATLPPDQAMVDGRATMTVRLARGGYNQINVSDVTQPSITGSSTQVRAISSGFHLEASITPDTTRAGDPFTLVVEVTNDAGSVIQEINSFVTLEVRNAGTQAPGNGTLLTTQFQLLQGQRTVSETYTFSEPIVIIARDDAGNAPATTNPIVIVPGAPAQLAITSNPSWVGGNKHATLDATLTDAYGNGVWGMPATFTVLSGEGTITPIDSLTDAAGRASADFLSARTPQTSRIRASAGGRIAELDLETALVDPTAPGGYVTNYPNPFRPPSQPTTIAWRLADDASVTLRIFTPSGTLVRQESFDRGATGGTVGLNEWAWDGRNGAGSLVASGGYVVFVEAEGTGETLHVMRRRVAVVR